MRKALFLVSVLLLPFVSSAQESAEPMTSLKAVPFYKWEIGIDLLPLADKSKDAFGYIVKRNFQTENGRQALRFKLLPRFVSGPGGSGADAKDSSIKLALGFERQKMYGHFSVLYGLEPYFSYRTARTKSTTTGIVVTRQNDTSFGVAGFVGGRYYVGNHVSFTLESHLVYQFQDQNGSIDNVGSYFARTHILFAEPLHAVYVSYQF
ncbi:hypothetical protein [Spirosoma sp. KUDC1026]|uniref:hypothetical protein n=1 Tax=Spirosoma sp. KUDC1026 TaxID=2745947 RepID=UPI00159BCC10|nr:hypothetical protein [Spirosoma sp. KUDC1026]QKZ14979.1 hypothetical protein HU175_21075 [Spirosoma sp. KUDC1026]